MQTPSFTQEAFAALGGPALVYVKQIRAEEIINAAPAEALSAFELTPDQALYAVHRADGERLAVLADRDQAYAAALAHELVPVSVH